MDLKKGGSDLMSQLGNKEVMAENIKTLMSQHGIDRKQLSNDLQISYTTISDWINAKTYPRIDKIELLANYFNVNKSDLVENKNQPIEMPALVPILGKVAAGKPEYAQEDIEGYMTLPPSKVSNKGLMYLKVKSDSMDKMFPVGSYVLVDTEATIDNGNVAVVKINDNEATLKKVKFNDDKEEIILIPESTNDIHTPTFYQANETDVFLIGKVIGMYMDL